MAISLLLDHDRGRPAFDTAVSHALLRRAGAGRIGETLRLHRPGKIVTFGRQDTVSHGYPAAVQAARRSGWAAVERLAGGRAAVFHPGTIAFSWTVPAASPREDIHARFTAVGAVMIAALHGLGIDARLGEIPGEYCPGMYSVNVAGTKKVLGVGQRIIKGAAHVGGVVVVEGGERIAEVLVPVYAALGLAWDPATAGDLVSFRPEVTYELVEEALLSEFDRRFGLVESHLDEETLALAVSLEPSHLPPG